MSALLPKERPKLSAEDAHGYLAQGGVNASRYPCALLGLRAYYRNTMGKAGVNDRGIYDDAICLITPSIYATFNANTDPSIYRPRVASLRSGLWFYKVGTHGLSKPKAQRYTALVQAQKVRVNRDDAASEAGWFGINIHRGSKTGTSSLGCQTIWPGQWDAFIATVRSELKREGQTIIPYLLLDA